MEVPMTCGRQSKIPFRELERATDALRDGLADVIRLGGWSGCGVLRLCRFPDSGESVATHDKNGDNTKKAHSRLRYSEKGYLSDRGKSNVGLLALVVRKGSNFDPLLCGLSPPVSVGRLKARRY